MSKQTVLLTGATGNMGQEGLKQLYAHNDRFDIVLLSLDTPKDRKILKEYQNDDSVKIVWGDLTNYEDVQKAVAGVDIVLHVGALVSPMADKMPKVTWKVNFGGTKNLVDAVLERSDSDKVKFLYVGTIAETGNRAPPYHWGRIGDPIVPSVYDYYALSKIAAERYLIQSDLKLWVSVRQTGILHDNILSVNDGIGYHQPLDNRLEWVTARDAGRLLLNVCSSDVPLAFWRNAYNIGGGESCRLTAMEFSAKIQEMLGVDFTKVEHPNWYATRNFHGHYYYDSDVLEEYLHFRSEEIDDVLDRIKTRLPFAMKIMRYLPTGMLRSAMRKQALKGDTPLAWIRDNNTDKINAFYGSKEKRDEIPSWDEISFPANPSHEKLDHGYDEGKADSEFDLEDMKSAAEFRGGKCVSADMENGDMYADLEWECGHNHSFTASPYLVLKAGHWCDKCMETPWNFDEQAKSNSFMAQVWYADHDRDEDQIYS